MKGMTLFLASLLFQAAPPPKPAPEPPKPVVEAPPAPAAVPRPAGPADISAVRTVYLLPMGSGFDQYLANRLVSSRAVKVVTDPRIADAVFTDRIGEGLEAKLQEIYAPPKPPARPKDKEGEKEKEEAPPAVEDRPPRFGIASTRGRGNVFLVNPHTKIVLWSIMVLPSGAGPKDLDEAAEEVTRQYKKAAQGK